MLTKIGGWLCLCPSARTPLRRRRIDSPGLKRRMGIRVGLDSSAALKAAYSNQRCRRFSRSGGILSQRHPPPNFPYPNTINNLKLPERDGEIMHSMDETTTDAAFERETTITLSDGDTLVRIWTSQHHVIQHLRKDKRFTETTDPSRCITEEAEFTIPRTEWTPWGGAKHLRQLTDEQQIMEQAVADIWEYWPFRRTARYRAADQGADSGRGR